MEPVPSMVSSRMPVSGSDGEPAGAFRHFGAEAEVAGAAVDDRQFDVFVPILVEDLADPADFQLRAGIRTGDRFYDDVLDIGGCGAVVAPAEEAPVSERILVAETDVVVQVRSDAVEGRLQMFFIGRQSVESIGNVEPLAKRSGVAHLGERNVSFLVSLQGLLEVSAAVSLEAHPEVGVVAVPSRGNEGHEGDAVVVLVGETRGSL